MKPTFFTFPILFFSLLGYLILAYWIERTAFVWLLSVVGLLFGGYGWIMAKGEHLSWRHLLWAGILFRLCWLGSLPALSDDYWRFIWDGRLWLAGEHPFAHPPDWYMAEAGRLPEGLTPYLYEQLNHTQHYSIYPTLNQIAFILAALSPTPWGSVLILRLIGWIGEGLALFFLLKLLRRNQIPEKKAALFWLNPLIIIELTGNLHFEGWMIAGLLAGGWYVGNGQIGRAGAAFSTGIAAKLLPMMALPLLWRWIGWKKAFLLYAILGVFLIVWFIPLFSDWALLQHMANSIELYFNKFEFNASIYYLMRWHGYQQWGYNVIAQAGPQLSLWALGIILSLSWWAKNEQGYWTAALLAFGTYLFLAIIVHPWYITTLVALSPLTKLRFGLVWSAAAYLSYAAYQSANYQENLSLVALEYLVVYGWLIAESIRLFRRRNPHFQKSGNHL